MNFIKQATAKLRAPPTNRVRAQKTCCSMEMIDTFSQPIGFGVGDGIYNYSTGWGACFTMTCIFMCLLYGIEKAFVQQQLS